MKTGRILNTQRMGGKAVQRERVKRSKMPDDGNWSMFNLVESIAAILGCL